MSFKKHIVGVIGLGHVGAHVAFNLGVLGIADEVKLCDVNHDKLVSERQDFMDAVMFMPHRVNYTIASYGELADCDVIVNAIGDIKLCASGNRDDEMHFTVPQVADYIPKVMAGGFKGIIINISNPCDAVTTILQQTTGLPKNRVFGTGTFLDTARMQRAVGDELGQDPRNVDGFVLGEHGNSQFVAWSTVSVDHKPAVDLFDEETRKTLNQRTKDNAFKVAFGKGFTSYAVATCGVRLVQAVFSDAHLFAPTSVYVPSVETYIGYPSIIGANGVEKVVPLKINDEEQKLFEESANYIKKHVADLA